MNLINKIKNDLKKVEDDHIEPGYRSAETIRSEDSPNLKIRTIREILSTAYDNGLVDRKQYRINGRMVYYYRDKNFSKKNQKSI